MSARDRGPRRALRIPGAARVRAEIDAELRFHLEERVDELVAEGMSREEAEAEVRRRFGDAQRIGSELASIDRAGLRRRSAGEALSGWARSLRQALRGVAARPAHSAAVVLTLALAIGANTAIYSAVRSVLVRPLPVPDMERVLAVQWDAPEISPWATPLSAGEVNDLTRREDLFEAVTGFTRGSATLTGAGDARRVSVAGVMGDFAAALGVQPAAGTFFGSEASVPGSPPVAVIGHALWSALGRDPAVVGRTLTLDGQDLTVVGVLPESFRYPGETEIWRPFLLTERALSPERRRSLTMMVVARLRPGVTPPRLEGELAGEVARWNEQYGGAGEARLSAVPLRDHLAGELRPVLLVLLGAVSFVLLIACANVASLQLVRTAGRSRETAVRLALGAGRGAVLRHFLLESLVYAALGGAAGLALGVLALRAFERWSPAEHEALGQLGLDAPVLAFTAAVTLLSGLVFGLAPAWRASRVDAQEALKETGGRGSMGRRQQRLLQGAVVAQLALTLVLLAGSGVLVRSLGRLLALDPGFSSRGVVTMQITPAGSRYGSDVARLELYERVLARVQALPGVEAAALTGTVPFSAMILDSSPFSVVGSVPGESDPVRHATAIPVTPDFFRALGVRVVAGRTFREGEGAWDVPVAIVDEQFARQYFPGEDAVGRQITHYGYENATIVGVVESVHQQELGAAYKANVYYPYRQLSFPWAGIVVRSALDPAAVTSMVARAVREVDPELPVYDVRTLRERVARSVGDRSLAAAVLGGFAALALLLALLGTYGVLSYGTAQRTQELGIRLAVGARPDDVVGMVLRSGGALAAVGLSIGLALYLGVSRVLESLLFGVGPRDPLVIGLGAGALLAAALLASWLPARRAARLDPVRALRGE